MNIAPQLEQLESAQLLWHLTEVEPSYAFRHALTQESAYDSLLKHQRREIHLRVAQAIEAAWPDQLDENAARLAQHYAEAHDDSKTAAYAIRAGDVAARVFAYPEARIQYALALDALARMPDDDQGANRRIRVDTEIKQISVSLRSQGPSETLKRLTEIEALAQPLGELPSSSREDRLRLARVHSWQGHALLHHGDARASAQKMRAVMTAARADEDLTLLAVSASIIGRVLVVQGQFAQSVPILSDAIAALERMPDEHEWIFSVGLHGFATAMRGDVARGVVEAESTLVRATLTGSLTGLSLAHFILAMTHLHCDSIPDALGHARATIDTSAKSGDRFHAFVGNGYLAWAQTRANQLDDAEQSFAQAEVIAKEIGGPLTLLDWFMATRMEYYFQRGEDAQVIALAEQAVGLTREGGAIFFTCMAQRAWGRALLRQNGAAIAQADGLFASSLAMFEEGDARVEAARTHFAWGNALSGQGARDQARTHFEKAAAQFEASGMTRELEETRAKMREAEIAR